MRTTLVADPPIWPDWSVTAAIASVASTLARVRERQATYGYREADSSLTPAVERLRELATAGGNDAAALANAAGHLAAAQRCLDDAWKSGGVERVIAASAALSAARVRLQGIEGSVVEAARAAIGRADSSFAFYAGGGFALDVQDPGAAAANAATCAAFALAAAELSVASRHLATAGGDGAASAAHAANLAARLAVSLAHAMSHDIGTGMLTPIPMLPRL